MGFSNMMSMVGGGGGPAASNGNPDVAAAHGDPAGGGGGAEHRNMNFGDKLLGAAESRIPFAKAFMPQTAQQGMSDVSMPQMPQANMAAPQADLIGMNARPPAGGGGLTAILKLLMGA